MEVLPVTSEQVSQVRKHFNANASDIKRDLGILKEWLKQEKPTTYNLIDDKFLERCLLRNKFRLEQTRNKLETYLHLRWKYLSMFQGYDTMIPSQQNCMTVPLPRLTPNLERVIVWKLKIPDEYNLTTVCKYNLWLFELLIRNDYAIGDRFIADFEGHTASTIARNNPLVIAKFIKLYQGSYSGRFVGCDFINAPSYISNLLLVLKQLIPKKLYNRIHVHKDLDSLHRQIPKCNLPKDYGGDLGSVEHLMSKWDRVFEESQEMFAESFQAMLEEKARSDNRNAGFGGSLKKLLRLD